jgi:hypothetical protein
LNKLFQAARLEPSSSVFERSPPDLQLRVRSSGTGDIDNTVVLVSSDNPCNDSADKTEASAGDAADLVGDLGANAEADGSNDTACSVAVEDGQCCNF